MELNVTSYILYKRLIIIEHRNMEFCGVTLFCTLLVLLKALKGAQST